MITEITGRRARYLFARGDVPVVITAGKKELVITGSQATEKYWRGFSTSPVDWEVLWQMVLAAFYVDLSLDDGDAKFYEET